MNLLPNWLRRRQRADDNYERAMKLSAEVIAKMRERARSPDPIRAAFADIFFQNHSDVALVADAYEAQQEARIFKGPAG